jgi:predicted site-specific integrase-resolvase
LKEAANFLQVAVEEMEGYLEAGEIRGKKLQSGWRVLKSALIKFLE